jgi:PAS domain S-box-containing protein
VSDGRRGVEARPITASSADQASEEGAALARSANELVAGGAGGARLLPTVLSDVPVAILLVNVSEGSVTYANRAATSVAGDQHLPMSVATWSEAAGLSALDGRPLGETGIDLLQIAGQGRSTGLTVRLQADRLGTRRLLWATGFPLRELEADQALVILFEVTGEELETQATIRERAIVATNIAFTITDPRQEDNPLVWVNPAFTAITGYSSEEAVGRNCRFLQGPSSDPTTVASIRRDLEAREPSSSILLNYRQDGTAFWNQLSISPVFDGQGELVSFVGVQTDVTERVRSDAERDRAFQEAQAARDRLRVLAEATGAMATSLEVEDALAELARRMVPSLADWVVFVTVDDDGALEHVVVHHIDGSGERLAGADDLWRGGVGDRSFLRRVMQSSAPVLVADFGEEQVRGALDDVRLADLCAQMGLRSAMFVPLLSRRRVILGALAFVSGPSGRVWDANDLEVATEVGRRAGLSVDNARLYQREHRAALTLQRSLLPEVPSIKGLSIATRYLPANTAADVGGDFYEVMELPGGSYGVAVGDIIGHDLTAAAAMGQLRILLRTLAWDRSSDGAVADPAEVLSRADEIMQSLRIAPLATALFARLDPPAGPDASWLLTSSNAGHPPLLVRAPDGSVTTVGAASDVLLGVAAVGRTSESCRLEPGTVLVAFTDGLVETPGGNLGVALSELEAVLSGYPVGTTPGVIVEALTARLGGSLRDDVALLAIGID